MELHQKSKNLHCIVFCIFAFLKMQPTANDIESQLEQFRKGMRPYALRRAATVGDGIVKLDEQQEQRYHDSYESVNVTTEKFVPASGAASRMFKSLLAWKNEGSRDESVTRFFQNFNSFPFAQPAEGEEAILRQVLDEKQWDKCPKGLLPFHRYANETRSAATEHLVEAMDYLHGHRLSVHFTVSPEHVEKFKRHLDGFCQEIGGDWHITFSIQNPATDTVTVDMNNLPVVDAAGKYIFRPAGHGALLENLNAREADLLFIKNIDNVVPDRLKAPTVRYKKILAGVLLHFQQRSFEILLKHDRGEDITAEGLKLLKEMGLRGEISPMDVPRLLNRPLRVCGMVKNQGEPGGGPFWVRDAKGRESLQIVESAQVDKENLEQLAIFQSSTHFNPVDLVCGIRNYKGEKFDLMNFRDPDTGFIAVKSYNGLTVKALELPGLWNGSMAHWNTVFVEVPLITFNPVKTVNDLLKPEHQP